MPEVPREDAYNSVHRGTGGYQENSQTHRSMGLESKTLKDLSLPRCLETLPSNEFHKRSSTNNIMLTFCA